VNHINIEMNNETLEDNNNDTSDLVDQEYQHSLYLDQLITFLGISKKQTDEYHFFGSLDTEWGLVISQVVLLVLLLVFLSCSLWYLVITRSTVPTNPSVVAALRKLSPNTKNNCQSNYNKKDHSTLALTNQDCLHTHADLSEDSLHYLDLEAGHRRLSRLSFGSSDGVPGRLSRISVASCESCSSVSVRGDRISISSELSSTSRRQSTENSRKGSLTNEGLHSIRHIQRKIGYNNQGVLEHGLNEELEDQLNTVCEINAKK